MSTSRTDFCGLPTMVGSLPHTDPELAVALVYNYLPALPAWPQLPRCDFTETMYAQFSEGFPGLTIEGERIFVDRTQDISQPLEQLYFAYLEGVLDDYALGEEYGQGLHALLASEHRPRRGVKGQVTGPISFGLAVTDQNRRPILYDDVLADALAKHLRLKVAWQERQLRAVSSRTIIFVDEPALSSFGSAFVAMPKELVVSLLEEVFAGIQGFAGIHCCGNTDWSVVLSTSVDIVNLDAYNYGESITLYPQEVADLFERGGAIAWGIVPNTEEDLAKESVASLLDRWEAWAAALSRKGISATHLRERCLVTPSCGLAGLSEEAAERALELTAMVSARLRKHSPRHGHNG